MKVKMLIQVLATRPGGMWPAAGQIVEVSDLEGAELCASGVATPVAAKQAAEKAVPPVVAEKRARAPRPSKKAQ